MDTSLQERIKCIDYLKTMAIIGILLYHVEFLSNGYLGVEVFFVISGYLFVKENKPILEKGFFNPIKFLIKRIAKLWPAILLGGGICLIIGHFSMLPDDYENLAETVFASNFFSNNILQAITTRNYWDVRNIYKPLMHTWYVGVYIQSFSFLVIVLWIARKIFGRDYSNYVLIILTIVSAILFILPIFPASNKFYYFPFRLFEITIGGCLIYLPEGKTKEKVRQSLGNIGFFILFFLLFSGISLPNTVCLPLAVGATCLILYTHASVNEDYGISESLFKVVTLPGKYSYGIYVWHQIVIAFLIYALFQEADVILVLLVSAISIILSASSVYMGTKRHVLKNIKFRIIASIVLTTVTSVISLYVYSHAGVVRDIPELGIDKNNVHRNMHSEYVDTPYSWDMDFTDKDRIHVLVMGNSYGRDFANILHESDISDKIEISYIYGGDASEKLDRVKEAHFVFYGTDNWEIPDWIKKNVENDKLYIIGNKEFGKSNGIIYARRNEADYFDQKMELSDDFILRNNAMKGEYGNHYIDMISPLMTGNCISVFTDDNYYISQDCRHLTKYGAQYYSRILDLSFIVQ